MKLLTVLFYDQLTESLIQKNSDLLFIEAKDAFTDVLHHKKKIAFLLSAMRHFAKECEKSHTVHYIKMEDAEPSYTKNIQKFLKENAYDALHVIKPSSWELFEEVKKWPNVEIIDDSRFFCSEKVFQEWAKGKKELRMENFYRLMRKNESILVTNDGKPKGGQFNFDKENRKKLPKNIHLPSLKKFTPDEVTKEVIKLVEKEFVKHPGSLDDFWFAVTRKDALAVFRYFIKNGLDNFGDYQDAMDDKEHFLFHSVISHYLNCGLLVPREVCKEVEKSDAPINAVEGYIRQILGWREYVRGIYWLKMPKYKKENFFNATRPLPAFYWNAKTDMRCMQKVISYTLEDALSHHIQRLMVTGNFALLAGISPQEVCDWYLAIYADAHDWVELPNTLSMALFADGGFLASKPYAASGNYIQKMSNFCSGCRYTPKKRTGDDACPFTFLYWDFLDRNKKKLEHNQRLTFAYKNLSRIDPDELKEIKAKAKDFFDN